jgi:hypothetical protein
MEFGAPLIHGLRPSGRGLDQADQGEDGKKPGHLPIICGEQLSHAFDFSHLPYKNLCQ